MSALCEAARRRGRQAGFRTFVWAGGSETARGVIVGEAPGAEEVRDGKPFVGRAGRLLRSEMEAVGLHPDGCWITNVVKHRPTQGPAGRANRAPNTAEVRFWQPYFLRELDLLRPRCLLCLGSVAAKAVIPGFDKMGSRRGRWVDLPSGVRAMATYHPSYVLRAQAFGDAQVGADFRRDLAEFAAMVMSDQ